MASWAPRMMYLMLGEAHLMRDQLNTVEILVAFSRPVQSRSENKVMGVDSPDGFHDGSVVAD